MGICFQYSAVQVSASFFQGAEAAGKAGFDDLGGIADKPGEQGAGAGKFPEGHEAAGNRDRLFRTRHIPAEHEFNGRQDLVPGRVDEILPVVDQLAVEKRENDPPVPFR